MRGKEGLQEEGERTKQSKEDFPSEKPQEEKAEEEFLEQLQEWRASSKSAKAKKPKIKLVRKGLIVTLDAMFFAYFPSSFAVFFVHL